MQFLEGTWQVFERKNGKGVNLIKERYKGSKKKSKIFSTGRDHKNQQMDHNNILGRKRKIQMFIMDSKDRKRFKESWGFRKSGRDFRRKFQNEASERF